MFVCLPSARINGPLPPWSFSSHPKSEWIPPSVLVWEFASIYYCFDKQFCSIPSELSANVRAPWGQAFFKFIKVPNFNGYALLWAQSIFVKLKFFITNHCLKYTWRERDILGKLAIVSKMLKTIWSSLHILAVPGKSTDRDWTTFTLTPQHYAVSIDLSPLEGRSLRFGTWPSLLEL